jgi:RNA polymerase sigma-70 factor (ECF subfamily)
MVSISDESVEDLIGRARDGESTALDQLLEVYRNYISLLARLQVDRRLQGRIAPSDLVQETILQAGRHFAGFRGCSEGELVVWLRRVLASQVAVCIGITRPSCVITIWSNNWARKSTNRAN